MAKQVRRRRFFGLGTINCPPRPLYRRASARQWRGSDLHLAKALAA
ncbi:hypothetical protein RGUI_3866 [Rhodovulum sp. P5]|nr:hypothetical protein RGUI_3866 [Rhodovulum sp. P5]